jgi:hypothetical protein
MSNMIATLEQPASKKKNMMSNLIATLEQLARKKNMMSILELPMSNQQAKERTWCTF